MRRIAALVCMLLLVLLLSPFAAAQEGWQAQQAFPQPGALTRADSPYENEMMTAAFAVTGLEAFRQLLLPFRGFLPLAACCFLFLRVRLLPGTRRTVNYCMRHMLACKTCHPQLAPPEI